MAPEDHLVFACHLCDRKLPRNKKVPVGFEIVCLDCCVKARKALRK